MRKLALAGFAAFLAACGGSNGSSSGNNNNNNNNGTPGLKTFSYGTPQAPTTAQQNTANRAQTQFGAAVNATVNGQIASAVNLPALTDSLANTLPAVVSMPVDAAIISAGTPQILALRHSGALSQGCFTYGSGSISYNNCTISSSGFTETLNGTETVGGSAANWNLTVNWNYAASGITENGTYTWTGQLSVTGTAITGQGRSTATGHYVGSGVTYDFQYTSGFDSNLNYQISPSFCLNGGTLEIRRTLNSSSSAGNAPVKDSGAKYIWSGCGSVQVASSP
jgi:hypothetical protein